MINNDDNMFSLENLEWKQFITDFYTASKEKNPNITLEQVYPIAQRKFIMNKKNTDIFLGLIANPQKIKKNK